MILCSALPLICFSALENWFKQHKYLFLWRVMEYIWPTLLISQQYEKLLVDTHFSTQHFGNSQDTISQTFLELEQTLPTCFLFCKSRSASLLQKNARYIWSEWLKAFQLFLAEDGAPYFSQISLCSCLTLGIKVNSAGWNTKLLQRVFSWHCQENSFFPNRQVYALSGICFPILFSL